MDIDYAVTFLAVLAPHYFASDFLKTLNCI